MEGKYFIGGLGVISIAVIESCAILTGTDGAYLSVCVGAIASICAGLGGYGIGLSKAKATE